MDAAAEDDNPGVPLAEYNDVQFPRREMAPEAEQYWVPISGPWPAGEEQVDEFLLSLPVEAIEHYVAAMEEGTMDEGTYAQSMRALAFWFRDKRETYVNSRMSRREPGIVALAHRASALADASLADPGGAAAEGQLGLALALLGATADTLGSEGQRGAVDSVLMCLGDGQHEATAQALSHNPAVTVAEACRGIADVLTLDAAHTDDFHAVTALLLTLWDVEPLAVKPAPSSPAVPPLSHASAVGEICERAYIALSNRRGVTPEETAGMASVPLSVLTSAQSTLSEQVLAVHMASGLVVGMLERYGGPAPGELEPLQAAVFRALDLADSPPRLSKKLAREALQRAVRGHVAGAFARCTPRLVEQQIEAAGLPLPRGVPEHEPPEMPRRISTLLLKVLVDDTLRLPWAVSKMSDGGIGDEEAIADLDAHVASEHFAQHEVIGAALGETFTAEPPFSERRLETLKQLGKVAQTVYDFALDAGMVALMRRLPAAQSVLKASFQSYANFASTALAMPPLTPEQLRVASGGFMGVWKERMAEATPLIARLTGDECAAVVLSATQLEVFQTQVDHEDGYAAYYQGLSDAVAACFVADSDHTDEDDQVAAAEIARELPLAPWKLKLLECVPEYTEMISIYGEPAEGDFKADPAVISRCYLSTLMLGAPDVLPQYPWEVIEERIIPTSFLLLQHMLAPLNERTHGIFRVVFEAYPDKALSLMPQYINLSLACYPAVTQPVGFEDTIRILARTLSDDHDSLEWCLGKVRARCDEILPMAEEDDETGQQRETVAQLFRTYASFFLHVEIPSIALVRHDCETWLQTGTPAGTETANTMLFESVHAKVFESFDYTRKFEISRWYIDMRERYAINNELPEPPVPPDPDDPFGLGPMPPPAAAPPMAGADGAVTPEQAAQMAQMTAERAMESQSMTSRVLSRIRAPFGGGGGGGEGGTVATGVAAVGAAGRGPRSGGGGLARSAGWVWPLSRM